MSGRGWEQVVQAVVIRFVLVVPNDKPRVTPLCSVLYKHEGRITQSSTQSLQFKEKNKQTNKKPCIGWNAEGFSTKRLEVIEVVRSTHE